MAFEIRAICGIVPFGQLHTTYAQEKARTHAAGLIGPPLGGLLYGLGRAAPFVVDAVTFLAAAIFYVLKKVPHRSEGRPPPPLTRMARSSGRLGAACAGKLVRPPPGCGADEGCRRSSRR